MADEITDAIEMSAAGPKSASADGVSVNQHSLPDQIEADRYLASKTAAHADPRKAFTMIKLVPPGAV